MEEKQRERIDDAIERECLWTRSRRWGGETKGGKDGERVYKFKEGRREGTKRVEENEVEVVRNEGEERRDEGAREKERRIKEAADPEKERKREGGREEKETKRDGDRKKEREREVESEGVEA